MATTSKRSKQAAAPARQQWDPGVTYNLATTLSEKPEFILFESWIVGNTPLIVHAWSEKAKRQMLEKQVGAVKKGKEQRQPHEDFRNALYVMDEEEGIFGFPAMAIKNCFLSAAHRDKNIPRTSAQAGLWIDGDMVRLRPGLEHAICDMPLLRIYGSEPEMREDMVSIGSGFKKVANLAYRPQFTHWAIKVRGRTNPLVLSPDKLARLAMDGGMAVGLGEWRAEKKGYFGSFHLADAGEETDAWNQFAAGTGPLPVPESYLAKAA